MRTNYFVTSRISKFSKVSRIAGKNEKMPIFDICHFRFLSKSVKATKKGNNEAETSRALVSNNFSLEISLVLFNCYF